MKIRGSVVKFTVVSAVALLACSFLLVAGLHLNRNSSRRVATRSSAVVAHDASSAISNADRSKFLDAYGRLPLSFVENQGQTAQEVRYVSHGGQYDLFPRPSIHCVEDAVFNQHRGIAFAQRALP